MRGAAQPRASEARQYAPIRSHAGYSQSGCGSSVDCRGVTLDANGSHPLQVHTTDRIQHAQLVRYPGSGAALCSP
jgi:hypothetical protein